jgi:hypothetical protein
MGRGKVGDICSARRKRGKRRRARIVSDDCYGGREGAGERTEALFFRLVAELGSEVG